ncbi:Uma2 family endonuclease [Anabaena sp. UHCC 0204]|uniref:Uma2 family endonuclease n=1 Tax=Anabaena sp. UHCC 0204 TaxID=2590009 RepID=UPI0014450715|nr:Uma2 family endonuclease [Anabaena sp. UHCC 0204]MTJ07889.1 Uma2 family endonuclease [Anabaena sp. UHCC 0204]
MVTIQIRQLTVPPGHRIILHNISWQEFEEILTELGENRASRLAYHQGNLEIKMPLPKHEVAKVIIGDLVKIILEELEIDCECFGSTTFKRQDMNSGIEPDDSFYIQNHVQMIGKEKIDLNIDPPPDLVIEIDVTSKTQLDAYLALAVPEVWRYENDKLQINILQNGKYIESEISPNFPNLPISEIIPQFVEQSRILGRSPTLRKFRQWVKQQ